MQDRLDQTLIDGVGVLYLSCFEMLFILSSFLMTTPWDPYYFYFYSGFSGLLPLAVRSPCKVLYVLLVVLQGVSGVGCPTCSVNNYSWFPHGMCRVIPLSSALVSPYARVSYSHRPQFPLLCDMAPCCWLLLWVLSSSGGAILWCLCSSVYVKVVPHSFFKKITSYYTLSTWYQEAPGSFMKTDIFWSILPISYPSRLSLGGLFSRKSSPNPRLLCEHPPPLWSQSTLLTTVSALIHPPKPSGTDDMWLLIHFSVPSTWNSAWSMLMEWT